MTAEGLHSKADIAKELAFRDKRIADLERQLSKLLKVAETADLLILELGAKGEITTLHKQSQDLLDALNDWSQFVTKEAVIKHFGAEARNPK